MRATNAVRLVALVVVLLACALPALWFVTVFADRSKPLHTTQVVVFRGETFAQVASALARDGVIDNALAFRILGRLRHADSSVRAGEYAFAPHESADDVLHSLLTGGAQVAAWVTIPEGFTAAQIARRFQHAGLGSAAQLRHDFLSTPLVVDGTRAPNLEGYLFPSTYLVTLGATPRQIEKQLVGQFFQELPRDALARARALHVTVPQLVTVASLVEREAKIEADRPMIAAVIYNRLRLGMPLQIDATIEYALPHHQAELSLADLRIDSPYNTYTHDGLPPTPIANPGLPSLEAALHPAKTDDLYYVYCGNGRHVFAKTLAQHDANVARCLH
jgi:UPF0755 protein